MKKQLPPKDQSELIRVLKSRFQKNSHLHKNWKWEDVEERLKSHPEKLWSLQQMESTGGEPDVVDKKNKEFIFFDCSQESPAGRRSLCYDQVALDSRKENKPKHSAIGMAYEMGVEILTEEQYRFLQSLGKFDLKTSSWVKTPDKIRELGGALFCDRRYDSVFIYHNGAESYYAARGFRGFIQV